MTIDGTDIANYGLVLQAGSFDSLLRYPKRKPVAYNNWAEHDGIEPDVSTVEFEPKKVQPVFSMLTDSLSSFETSHTSFYDSLSAPGSRHIVFTSGIQRTLRFTGNSKYDVRRPFGNDNHETFTLDFTEDAPAVETGATPAGTAPFGLYAVNGKDFGLYGIGGDENISDFLRHADLKEPFTDGQTVYTDVVKKKHREIKFPLWMIAFSETQFLRNYRAFFAELAQPGEQTLSAGQLGKTVRAYYTDCTSFRFTAWRPDFIGLKFNITMTESYDY
jgi:hypothetical protein